MTDKARELLERALDYVHKRSLDEEILRDEIRAYLAQPEVKREAIGDYEINEAWRTHLMQDLMTGKMNSRDSFLFAIRFAEKHHGIGCGDE